MKINKGEYGYLRSYKRKNLIISFVLLAMIVFIIISLKIMFGDTKRVGVIFAILLALPFAKFLISYIMVCSFKSMDKQNYKDLSEKLGDSNIIYDIVLSRYEGMCFYYAICIKNGWAYALVPSKDFSTKKKEYEACIAQVVCDTKYNYKVKIYKDDIEFIKKVTSAGTPNDNTRIVDKYFLNKLVEIGV